MNLCHSRMETYGFSQGDWLIVDHRFDHDWLEFSLTRENKRFGPFKAHLSGMHNLQNCAAAIICGLDNGIDEDILAAGLAEFMGVKRRLEHRGDYGGVTIYDDFAHHPTAIMETIKGIKTSYPQRTTWAVFEPRTNTMRRKNLAGNLEKSLAEADKVLLLPVDHPEKIKAAERLDPELIVKNLSLTGKKAFGPQTMEEAIDILQQNTSPGDVVVFMSNGSLEKMIIEYIEQRKKS